MRGVEVLPSGSDDNVLLLYFFFDQFLCVFLRSICFSVQSGEIGSPERRPRAAGEASQQD